MSSFEPIGAIGAIDQELGAVKLSFKSITLWHRVPAYVIHNRLHLRWPLASSRPMQAPQIDPCP